MQVEGLSINLATIREQCGFAEAVDLCLKHGITKIAPWRDQIAKAGIDEAVRIVKSNGLKLTGLCRGGFFPAANDGDWQKNLDDNRRAIDEAASLGADCLVLVVGGLAGRSRDIGAARQMVSDGIAAVLPHAKASGVPLAIEPLHPMYAADRSCVNTLRQALDMCELLGTDVGVAIDVYHVWWDPELAEQIARAGQMKRIFAHHICDWLVPTKDMLTDRGMMGDGVIDLKGIRRMIEKAGFFGAQEVEIFSADNWWKRPAEEVIATCVDRYHGCCLV
jgi:sugar phosphate isomerase/epimerase